MRDKMLTANTPRISLAGIVLLLSTVVPFTSTSVRNADAAAPITPSGLNTRVSAPLTTAGGKTQYDITGGTRPGGGTNLFHSFGQFNVPTNNIANFLNDSGLATSNILGRVTGGNPSTIFGMIQTTGFGNANLFLMNPAGFLFGPNATINVGGMVAFTTADYVRLADGVRFNAVPDAAADALLSPAPVAAFGFLGFNPAAIAVQGSRLTVQPGQSISLVGGNQGFTATDPDTGNPIPVPGGITMTGGKLTASGGQINLASVASPGEISAFDFMPTSGMSMGNITLSQGAALDVSGNAAGTVRIRGGQLVIADATISADTGNTKGASTAIDINVTGDLSITDTRGVPALTAMTTGNGNAGAIQINSANLIATSTFLAPTPFALIDTHTSSTGNAGNVNVTTGNLQVSYQQQGGVFLFIDSGTAGPGHGGDVSITAQNINMQGTTISTGDFVDRLLSGDPSGSGGNVTITADSLTLTTTLIDTGAFLAFDPSQQAGNVSINAHDITMSLASSINALGFGGGGAINIQADTLAMDNSALLTETATGQGGAVTINARTIDLINGSQVLNTIDGVGQAGDIRVTATDHIVLSTAPTDTNPSGFFSNSTGFFGDGNAGSIVINTPILQMTGGSRINSATASGGRGGDVTINAPNMISISGEFPNGDPEPIFGIGTIHPSGIFTASVGGACSGPCGDAGNISITTGSLSIGSGGQINSGTSTAGHGGNITIHASDTISLTGTLSDGSPAGIFSRTIGTDPGAGNGGNILLQANSVTIQNGAQISASSLGSGNAGSVTIEGTASPAQVLIDGAGSGIFTDTQVTGAGGSINIFAQSLTVQNGGALSAATSGTAPSATGGSITVNANQTQLNSAATITTATSGPGNAGDILVKADTFSMNGGATITAASTGSGAAGTVTIEGTASPAQSVLSDGAGSGIFTTTSGTGAGGNIFVNANTVTLQNGGTLSAKTSGTDVSATGGTIAVNANQVQLNNGGLITAASTGAGDGGSITIGASSTFASNASSVSSTATQATGGDINIGAGQSVTLNNGSSITASSIGAGNAGNIVINAGQNFFSTNSSVTTEATAPGTQALGGNITVNAANMVQLTNSQINASVQGASETIGGNIVIDPQFVILQNSQILTQATQGQGGNITITTNLLLPDANSVISASSQFGVNGTVTVQSPNAPATGKIIPLSQKPLTATALLSQRCAALASGEFSSFTVAGRDSLPAEPGGWLASPLALATSSGGTGLEARGEGREGMTPGTSPAGETPLLTLRQIAPPGFLTQAFAVDWSAGCTS